MLLQGTDARNTIILFFSGEVVGIYFLGPRVFSEFRDWKRERLNTSPCLTNRRWRACGSALHDTCITHPRRASGSVLSKQTPDANTRQQRGLCELVVARHRHLQDGYPAVDQADTLTVSKSSCCLARDINPSTQERSSIFTMMSSGMVLRHPGPLDHHPLAEQERGNTLPLQTAPISPSPPFGALAPFTMLLMSTEMMDGRLTVLPLKPLCKIRNIFFT